MPQSEFPVFTFPHLCVEVVPYDNLDFPTFPTRSGWSIPNPSQPWIFSRSPAPRRSEKLAFLQAWLFFGGISEVSRVCGLDMDAREFSAGPGELSTRPLNGLAGRWIAVAAAAAARTQCGERVRDVYRLVAGVLRRWNPWDGEGGGGKRGILTYAECRVLLSISVFCRVVLLAVDGLGVSLTFDGLSWYAGEDTRVVWEFAGEMAMMEYARAELVRRGWCRSEIAYLEGAHQKYSLFFASTLERPLMVTDHARCGEMRCLGDQVEDDDGYRTVHVTPECCCAMVEVAGGELASVLRRKRIPRIVVTVDGDTQLRAEVVEDGPYMAISHVWSHGLGNPHKNALPTCQLARLKSYAEELCEQSPDPAAPPLPSKIALWIDTLCIPVNRAFVQDRKRAIVLLGETYSRSTAVLVLDRELQLVSRTASTLEILLRIYCSGWMRRLWTLQEACLVSPTEPWKLWFRLLEGALAHASLDRNVLNPTRRRQDLTPDVREHLLLYETIIDTLANRILPIHALRRGNDLRTPFTTISRAVSFRSTSKAADEPLCMAGLMGYDVARVLSHDSAAARMAVLYIMLGEVPADLIFVPKMAKLMAPPFRWAPASILANEHHGFQYRQKPAGVVTDRGLVIRYAGFVLSAAPQRNSRWIVHDPVAGEDADMFLWTPADMDVITGARTEREFPERAALVFQHPNAKYGHVAVVAVENESDDGMYTVRIVFYAAMRPGWVPGRDGDHESEKKAGLGLYDVDFVPATEEEGPFERIVGTYVDAGQRWCVA